MLTCVDFQTENYFSRNFVIFHFVLYSQDSLTEFVWWLFKEGRGSCGHTCNLHIMIYVYGKT